jgi:predicted RNA-binding protein with PUA-like domain
MNHWLVKSEPGVYSWGNLVADKRTNWNGVRNFQASNNLRAMKKGDRVFFYHSGGESEIVGIAGVAREFYPDPDDKTGRFGMVDLVPVMPVEKPVGLGAIKAEARLAGFGLVRQGRLSVVPVSATEWKLICAMGKTKA